MRIRYCSRPPGRLVDYRTRWSVLMIFEYHSFVKFTSHENFQRRTIPKGTCIRLENVMSKHDDIEVDYPDRLVKKGISKFLSGIIKIQEYRIDEITDSHQQL